MKKAMIMAVVAAMLLAGCEKDVTVTDKAENLKSVRFELDGDFGSPTFTRALSADGSAMTDVWVFDFVNDECVQILHQESDEDDFGQPTLTMANGEHNVCFVVSRGDSPTVDETAKVISWARVSDTFWGEADLTVGQGTSASVGVTLNRVATKLKLVVTDEVPATMAKMTVTPAKWYYGLNYWMGEPADERSGQARTVNVPASYAGTSGQLTMSIYGISGSDEWNTGVTVTATDASDAVLGTATIASAPFKANRQTQYTGRLFSKDGGFTLTLNDEWQAGYSGEW